MLDWDTIHLAVANYLSKKALVCLTVYSNAVGVGDGLVSMAANAWSRHGNQSEFCAG